MNDWLILVPAGIGIGALGTFVGIGGGVFMMPILLLLYSFSPAIAAGTSLAAIFINSFCGTIAYTRQKRVDFRLGYKFALATVPGAIIGAYLVGYFEMRLYICIFAIIMLIIAVELLLQKGREVPVSKEERGRAQDESSVLLKGIFLSFLAGLLATMFGIGGGVIHVPFLILILGFTAHVATATSHFILAVTSFTGAAASALIGNVDFMVTAYLGIGLAIGALIGAQASSRARSVVIVRVLVVIIVLVAMRLFAKALFVV